MSFSDDVRKFADDFRRKHDAVFAGVVTEVHRSIVEGSQITGAPGQPVDTGHLRQSWNISFPDPHTAIVSTNVEYALIIEQNLRGAKVSSKDKYGKPKPKIGGFHSVALTFMGFDKIVEHVVRRINGSS